MNKFSIIIPTFNSERYLKPCLDSIKNINYLKKDYEFIIADGNSKDNTLEIAKRYKVKIIKVPNKSISQNRNLAAKQAKGEYLVFIDSDCIVDKEILNRSEKLSNHYDCFGSFYKPKKNAGWIARTWLLIEQKKKGIVDWLPAGTMIIKKNLFNSVGGFDEKLKTGEDFDLCQRLRKRGIRVYNEPELASIHLGQTDYIKDFFKKEMWRGNSLIKGVRQHGILREELLSTLLTFYHFLVILLIIISLFMLNLYLIPLSIAFFILPSFIMSLRKVLQTKMVSYIIYFWFLGVVYQSARAISIIRYNQFKDLF